MVVPEDSHFFCKNRTIHRRCLFPRWFSYFPLVSDLRKTGDYLIAVIGFSLFDLHCISLNWSLFSNASTPKGNSVFARDCLIKSKCTY